ncbi:MAG TPA: aminoglycoside phosphotransferase family protein [Bryobacteraceae bacterium]|nr:aminoglycoside phosphotransferase family protein [Bryobacteraceae bacterium]
MAKQYLGHLSSQDPLHAYLAQCVLPQMGADTHRGARFRVFSMKEDKVYLYEERDSCAQVVGKFFVNGGHPRPAAIERMRREFDNLQTARGFGLAGYPHHVVRPLGTNEGLNSMLVEEYAEGVPLSTFVSDAIHHGQSQTLYTKLTALAYFLATLHNRSANGHRVDFNQDCAYLDRIVRKLVAKRTISVWDADEFYWLRDRWREKPRMWEDNQVLVHGDATPSNLLFGRGLSVIAIDLERMTRADRVFDLGRITGELQHSFLEATGNGSGAEPFVGHFLWEYACHFPDRGAAFRAITGRLPFQMALTLLRIARNSWVGEHQRRRLVQEAKITLRTP